MARTVIDLDDEALEEAARFLGTTTKRDTVNTALREIVDRRKRAAALERMRQMVEEGEIDLSIIEEGPSPEEVSVPHGSHADGPAA
ncbi:type II toxin-antitoxin system VapB family antitoxin [Streptomyces sp. CB03234]|uniref:type II toxin-antitoxin system VapB family antitoxin n=1 Tax=Streptomyces sp. (strain CB03234) TaxID=1703937 RepID=UPI000939A6CE|nr:type II toxin-antitoxin system VapB family antitoxin [Streptomyces sp. CB03234]